MKNLRLLFLLSITTLALAPSPRDASAWYYGCGEAYGSCTYGCRELSGAAWDACESSCHDDYNNCQQPIYTPPPTGACIPDSLCYTGDESCCYTFYQRCMSHAHDGTVGCNADTCGDALYTCMYGEE